MDSRFRGNDGKKSVAGMTAKKRRGNDGQETSRQ